METDFAQLNIDGAVISEFKVVPSMKLVLTLLRGPEKQNERTVQTEHDLQFNFVKDFKIALRSEPWLQVVSHAVFWESDYLRDFIAAAPADTLTVKLAHFEVICVQGRFDIIARSFTFSLFNEIPYVSSGSES
ncbi:MAG TPA: hypothetical protein VGJ66_19860 [Pyrinomonadaceae bacterium]|jgi:hypothetical protein